jgi:hypothetical protein
MGTETKGNDITLIIDIKPSLQRLSAAQSQINTYENILGKTTSNGYTIYRGRTKIIITMDERTIFNEMLYNQNIYVIFVPRDIVYSDKPLPRSSYGRRLGRGLTVKLSRVTR